MTKVVSVNVGAARALTVGGRSLRTGIGKRPVAEAWVTVDGLVGDRVCNRDHHGGPDQAVYVYTEEDYAWFAAAGSRFAAGAFGENLTVAGVESAAVAVGDRFTFGAIALQATAPRIPCNVLSASVGEREFGARFRAAARPGFYCRVLRAGVVRAGDDGIWTPFDGERVTIAELFQAAYERPALEQLERQLRAPLSVRERARKARQRKALAAAGAGAAERNA